MATKISNQCYRFPYVDFEPESRKLLWKDQSVTILTHEESKILELLCHHAGEVLSSHALYRATILSPSNIAEEHNHLGGLLAKAYKKGKKRLPITSAGEFGFRIDIPKKTFQKTHIDFSEQNSKSWTSVHLNPSSITSKNKRFYKKISLIILICLISLITCLFLHNL